MKTTGNTILITGGGTGIGRGLAEAFHALDNRVIIAGRRQRTLDAVTAANPGMSSLTVDLQNAASIRSLADRLAIGHPALNVVIHNAGIQRAEDWNAPHVNPADAEAVIHTNLLGPIRLTAALLPLLRKQPASVLMTVPSGLAFVPMATVPTYCATKAAIHSYTQSLRHQLKGTTTEVIELIPPYVATELMSGGSANPRAMPLDKFIAEVMDVLKTQPTVAEICVENVKALRFVERGAYDAVFQRLNGA